ncbi:hypothetical protein PSACC_00755 [Paramicrosporidium saccamoebae]|uniref:Secreted protein n=1 Tax=Paramicrosporidium saccamoebae TaxID=1246581 RepID=A0A2H9TNS2_9FUNG|nr:hypothetical protein PSACC_00755 [Paramicrosporidium saccamoebae]
MNFAATVILALVCVVSASRAGRKMADNTPKSRNHWETMNGILFQKRINWSPRSAAEAEAIKRIEKKAARNANGH